MTQDYGASANAEQALVNGADKSSPPIGFDPSRLEIRPDFNGEFDEIVARFSDGMVHAEMMTDKSCYVGFYWDDGRYCQWWFGSKRGKLWNSTEDGQADPPRFTAMGVDTRPDEPDPYAALAMSAGTEKTPKAAEGEARQRGPEGETPKPPTTKPSAKQERNNP